MKNVILLDADIPVFQVAAVNQKEYQWEDDGPIERSVPDFEYVADQLDANLAETMKTLDGDRMIVCLSEPDRLMNWRKTILPSYKENRKTTVSPVYRQALSDYLEENYECFKRPTLEGDDVMGILATHPDIVKGRKIIVSIDKDMRTIPTVDARSASGSFNLLYNPDKDKQPRVVSLREANWYWMYQTLIGDSTDGYKGCPRIGPKKAMDLIGDGTWDLPLHDMWRIVVQAFEDAKYKGENLGLGVLDAMVQAQVARICRCNNYDFERKEVIPWNPSDIG